MMKNLMAVIAAAVCLFAIVSAAFAVEQSDAARNAVEFCETRYAGESPAKRLQQILCIQDQTILILQDKIKKGEEGREGELAKLREGLKETQAKLAKVELDAKAPPPPSIPPREVGRDESERGPAIRYAGVPHTVVQAPGQYAAATFDPGGPRLNLRSLGWGADKHARGAEQVRVVVKKNGAPLPVAHADLVRPWEPFYADLDGDGKPEMQPYRGLDPRQQNEVHIAMVGPRDRIELVYLVDTGKRVLIPGLPPQILWGEGRRVEYDRTENRGRWTQAAHGGWTLY